MSGTTIAERFSLAGKVAMVTGAGGGIGAEICAVLAEAGADIVGLARKASDLDPVAEAVRARGRRFKPVLAELADAAATDRGAAEALAAFGRIDILVNNAGIALLGSLLDMGLEAWDQTQAINLRAPFQLARAVAPGMIARKAGKIINVSSQAGVVALENHAAYCASKAGLNLLTKVMTVEWARHNIQTNAVCPTVILTPMGREVWGDPAIGDPMKAKIPLARFGEPVEVADLVLFLAAPASDLICGETILIDGGYTAV